MSEEDKQRQEILERTRILRDLERRNKSNERYLQQYARELEAKKRELPDVDYWLKDAEKQYYRSHSSPNDLKNLQYYEKKKKDLEQEIADLNSTIRVVNKEIENNNKKMRPHEERIEELLTTIQKNNQDPANESLRMRLRLQ